MSVYGNAFEEIKSRCNIVDVIGQVVTLKKAGSNYKGLCPFHNEKTPSFVVSETKQIFTCFGCGVSGNVFEFVKRYYNLDFREALEKLAKEYGVTLEQTGGRSSEKKDRMYELNRLAARFFFKAMADAGSPGYIYMKNRGISYETIKKFGIGYADDKWDSLYRYMTGQGADEETLVEIGLLSKSKGRYYDKFRDRVIFPIINTRGKIIGFGGRIIGEGTPKYLNSPESPIFLKKNNLYGLNLTRQEISKEDCAILVEGYMDVVSLYQSGVRNAAASLGTALTENQAKMLKRYTRNVVLSYDSDSAGQAAALRGIDILYNEGCRARVLHVTDGKDPDEFVKKKGRQAFLELVDSALSYADYKIDILKSRHNLDETDGRIEFVKETVAALRNLSPAERDIYIRKIAAEAKISEGAIRLEFRGDTEDRQAERGREAGREHRNQPAGDISSIEKNLIRLIINDSRMFETILPYSYIFKSTAGDNIFSSIKSIYTDGEDIDINKLADSLDEDSAGVFRNIVDNICLGGRDQEILEDCIITLEIEKLRDRYEEINTIIELADETENQEKIRQLMTEQMEIQKLMQQMKERG